MAYQHTNLRPLADDRVNNANWRSSSRSVNDVQIWSFVTDDTIATLLAPGYFDRGSTKLTRDDIILVSADGGWGFLRVESSDRGSVSVTTSQQQTGVGGGGGGAVTSVVGQIGAVSANQIILALDAEADTNFLTDAERASIAAAAADVANQAALQTLSGVTAGTTLLPATTGTVWAAANLVTRFQDIATTVAGLGAGGSVNTVAGVVPVSGDIPIAALVAAIDAFADTNFLTDAERAQLAAAVAAQHSHANLTILNAITNAGSGQIITAAERGNLATAFADVANQAALQTLVGVGAGTTVLPAIPAGAGAILNAGDLVTQLAELKNRIDAGGGAIGGDLTALEALAGTGFAVRTAADTWAQRSLIAPAAGFTITNPDGVAGDPTFVLANDLAALEALSANGVAERTGADTWATRAIGLAANNLVAFDANRYIAIPDVGGNGQFWFIGESAANRLEFRYGSTFAGSTVRFDMPVGIGTAGQLLAVNGGANGTEWVNAAGTTLPTTTKGDVIVHDGTTDVRLPVGTNNQVLVADSTTASGLAWSTRVLTAANATARDALGPVRPDMIVDVADDDGNGLRETYVVLSPAATFAAAGVRRIGQPPTFDAGGAATLPTASASSPNLVRLVNHSTLADQLIVKSNDNTAYLTTSAASLPTTTKGDIIVHDGTTDIRLPVGADGTIRVADSTTASGFVDVPQIVNAADATARDAAGPLFAGQHVVVADDDGSGNPQIYLVEAPGATFTAATTSALLNTPSAAPTHALPATPVAANQALTIPNVPFAGAVAGDGFVVGVPTDLVNDGIDIQAFYEADGFVHLKITNDSPSLVNIPAQSLTVYKINENAPTNVPGTIGGIGAIAGLAPVAGGAAGTSNLAARQDHQHVPQVPSTDANNLIQQGGDQFHRLTTTDAISTDGGNQLAAGTDNRLFVPAGSTTFANAISPAADDATGAVGVVAEAAREDHKHPAQGASADADNLIVAGADGLHRLEASADLISTDANNGISKGTDGKLFNTPGTPLTGVTIGQMLEYDGATWVAINPPTRFSIVLAGGRDGLVASTPVDHAFTVTNARHRKGSGDMDFTVNIDGVPVTGLTNVAVAAADTTTASTGANTGAAGAIVTIVGSNNASLVDGEISLVFEKTGVYV